MPCFFIFLGVYKINGVDVSKSINFCYLESEIQSEGKVQDDDVHMITAGWINEIAQLEYYVTRDFHLNRKDWFMEQLYH